MSCCGNKRASLVQPSAAPGSAGSPLPAKIWADLYFENTGDAPVTVNGNMTGKLYRWFAKGDLQAVDFRDADALRPYAAVLKKIR